MPSIIVPIFFIILNFIDALTDKLKGSEVKHKRGAFWYAGISFVACLIFGQFVDVTIWDLIAFPILTRMAFFDAFYLLLIREKLTYEGEKNKTDKSLIDTIEAWTHIPIMVLRVIYLLLFIGYLIYSLV